jgi:alginate O-acetyltransferase complex protein AlgJ
VEIPRNLATRARQGAGGAKVSLLPEFYNVFALLPNRQQLRQARGVRDWWALLPSPQRIKAFEDGLQQDSFLCAAVLPGVQEFLTGAAGAGNEKAYCGLQGWLFYRPEVDYVAGPGFLDPRHLARIAGGGSREGGPRRADPRQAILDFHRQLAARGIRLILMPTPCKPMIHPEKFAAQYAGWDGAALQNSSYAPFKAEMEREGLPVFDISEALLEAKRDGDRPQFLETDTHWRPEAMELAARRLKDFIATHTPLPEVNSPGYRRQPAEASNLGDIAVMLRLPEGQSLYKKRTVQIQQVTNQRKEFWRPSRSADVLVLGDSFGNVYSLEPMGWGEAAGFVEQIAFALQRPVDAILRNDAGAFATRQILSQELARGSDRLAGKKLVIWEFAIRELTSGDWKLLDLKLGKPQPSRFVCPERGAALTVAGVVRAASAAPRPRTVPYKDHIVEVHLTDLEAGGTPIPGGQAVVYLWSMRDNVWTPAARYRPDQKVTLKVRPWSDVSDSLGAINRSELDDEALSMEDPCWGEEGN